MCWFPYHAPELPIDIQKDLSSQEVEEGQDATFTCELSKPNQPVTWSVGGKPVENSDKYVIECHEHVYILTVKNCTLDDRSQVSIVAKDCKSSAQLDVRGMPILTCFCSNRNNKFGYNFHFNKSNNMCSVKDEFFFVMSYFLICSHFRTFLKCL